MGVRILTDGKDAALYCSTTDWAFGPVFCSDDEHDGFERAELFVQWLLPTDARTLTDSEMSAKYVEWLRQEPEMWKQKEAEVDA